MHALSEGLVPDKLLFKISLPRRPLAILKIFRQLFQHTGIADSHNNDRLKKLGYVQILDDHTVVEPPDLVNVEPKMCGLQREESIGCAKVVPRRRILTVKSNKSLSNHTIDEQRCAMRPDLISFIECLKNLLPQFRLFFTCSVDVKPGLFIQTRWCPSRGFKKRMDFI